MTSSPPSTRGSPEASPASGQRTSRGRWTRPTPPADSGPEPLIQLNPIFEPGGWPHTSKVGAAPGAQREITVPYTVRSLSAKSSPATQFYAGYPDTREDNNPRIHFPDGFDRDGCKVDVWVSKWSDHSRAGWDLAHECVHLLDPIMEKYATYLEEGLATWYQDSPQLHPDYQNIRSLVQGHINGHPEGMRHKDPKYRGAKELVQKCMPEIKSAVRSIRKKGAKQPMCGIVRSRP